MVRRGWQPSPLHQQVPQRKFLWRSHACPHFYSRRHQSILPLNDSHHKWRRGNFSIVLHYNSSTLAFTSMAIPSSVCRMGCQMTHLHKTSYTHHTWHPYSYDHVWLETRVNTILFFFKRCGLTKKKSFHSPNAFPSPTHDRQQCPYFSS